MKPTITATEIAHQNPYYHIRHDTLQYPDRVGHYYVAVCGPASLIIAIRDEKILLVNQYRHTMGQDSLEFPTGTRKEGETFEDAARRELQEEGGILAKKLIPLGSFYSLNGISSNLVQAFLAEGLQEAERHLDTEEQGLQSQWVPLSEFPEMIRSGKIQDGESLAAWTLYQSHLQSN